MIGDWSEVSEYVGDFLPLNELALIDSAPAAAAPAALRSVASAAATWQRWDHSWPVYVPPLSAYVPYAAGQIIELARAVIPWGMIGNIGRIDTAVIDATTGAPARWDNPIQWADKFEFFLVSNMEYSRLNGPLVAIPAAGVSYFEAAGGTPVARFGYWDDSRYAWGNPANEIDQPIPAGSIIRLFARAMVDIDFRHSLKGRLVWRYASESSVQSIMRAQQ